MSSSIAVSSLQESTHTPFVGQGAFNATIRKGLYTTALDPRGLIPVYEFDINEQTVMWDRETGFVNFTRIWKILGNAKSDIVKLTENNRNLGCKKIRGGLIKVQGTWLPFEKARELCIRTAWSLREELTVMFGPQFREDCLKPTHPDFGILSLELAPSLRRVKMRAKRKRSVTGSEAGVDDTAPSQKKTKRSGTRDGNGTVLIHKNYRLETLLNEAPQPQGTAPQTMTSQEPHPVSVSWSQRSPPHSPVDWNQPWEIYSKGPDSARTKYAKEMIDAALTLQRISLLLGVRPVLPLDPHTVPQSVRVGSERYSIVWR